MTQRRLLVIATTFVAAVTFNTRDASAQVVQLLPNLVPLPASEITIGQDPSNGHILLKFATINTNIGLGRLELRAGGVTSSGQQVFQRVYSSDGGFQDYLAGTMTYHPEHNHFHFNNFALYTLTPVGNSTASAATSEKTSFCVEDTTPINLQLPGAPQQPVFTTCNPDVQGLSVGWGDRYGPTLAGQSFDITNMSAGDYDLTIETDPSFQLLETSDSDNVSCVRLHIDPAARTFQALGVCGSVTVSSITPNSAKSAQTVQVTIKGAGFTSGIAVGFENGSGPAPTIRNVTVVDDKTITASVSVKNGGGKQPRVWDLRVGSGVLFRAFTVNP